MAAGRITVIGIGNPARGDDAVGRTVARALRGTLPDAVTVTEHNGEAADLLDLLACTQSAFLIDACASASAPGTVHRFDVAAAALPQASFDLSTHGLGLGEAIELARTLGQLPSHCVVYAVEAASVATGAPLSPAVAEAVDAVATRLRSEVDELTVAEADAHA